MENTSGHFLTYGGSWSEGIVLTHKDKKDGAGEMESEGDRDIET